LDGRPRRVGATPGPFSIVIMVVLVALLLAYRLTAAHRATHQPGR